MSRIHVFTAALALAACSGPVQARAIVINNPSFEATPLADGQFVRSVIAEWANSIGAELGVQNPTASAFPAVPEGENTAYLGSFLTGPFGAQVTGRFEQKLGESLQRNMRYTLSVDVGRLGSAYDLPLFSVFLLSGDKAVATGTFANDDIAPGAFRTLSFSFDSLENGTAPLRIAFQSFYDPAQGLDYRQVNFDNVRLEVTAIPANAVPEPAMWASMIAGFAIAGVGLRRRSRAKPVLL